jgi:general nucleoside transport system permease protein
MSFGTFTDVGLLQLAITFAGPLLLAAMGELLLERSGLLCVALEGIMAIGACLGFLITYFTGQPALGMMAALAIGGVFGLAFGYISVYMRANQVITGMGMLILGLGMASLVYRLAIGMVRSAPQVHALPSVKLPLLGDLPYVGQVIFTQPLMVYLAYLMVPAMSFVLYRTPLGLRIRACGESPRALDALGVDVFKIRLLCCVVGCAIVGLAGSYLPLVLTATYTDGLVGGRGWLALQVVIFGRHQAPLILLGSIFFGYLETLQFRLALFTRAIPSQFFLMLPYLSALLVLVLSGTGERPESLLKPYDREQKN